MLAGNTCFLGADDDLQVGPPELMFEDSGEAGTGKEKVTGLQLIMHFISPLDIPFSWILA